MNKALKEATFPTEAFTRHSLYNNWVPTASDVKLEEIYISKVIKSNWRFKALTPIKALFALPFAYLAYDYY